MKKADIQADNGMIHLMSSVIYPLPTSNIAEVVTADERFSTLLAAVIEADLVETLSSGGPFTVFAPTNDAFAKIAADDLNALLADKEALARVLLRHVVPGAVFFNGMTWDILETAGGVEEVNVVPVPLPVGPVGGVFTFNDLPRSGFGRGRHGGGR